MTHLRVAAVQVSSLNGQPTRNLDNAARHVADAVDRGAELVLCPEFLATGYVYDESIWRGAEAAGGPTERWLAELAARHNIGIGASYLEADGDEFFNTFALFHRNGLVGRVRKRSLPFFEGWFFTPCGGPKVLDAPWGRVGIGICNDNQTAEFFDDMVEASPDLILMPHSAPTPRLPLVERLVVPLFEQQLKQAAQRYADTFGVPVIMANKIAFEDDSTTLPIWPHPRVRWRFDGHSAICDARGTLRAASSGTEEALVADIELDPHNKRHPNRTSGGYWSFAPRLFSRAGGLMMRTFATMGRRRYLHNVRRVAAARASAGHAPGTHTKASQRNRPIAELPKLT